MPQPFLETGKQGLLISGLDINDPVRRQASLGDGGRKQILPVHAP